MTCLSRGTTALLAGGVLMSTLGIAWAAGQAVGAQGQGTGDQAVRRVEILGGRGSEIGVRVRDTEEADLKRSKRIGSGGVVVEEVRRDSPAERAGLRAGDLIVEFDGERVRSARQFARLVQETPVGRTVRGLLLRDGQEVRFEIVPERGSGPVVWGPDEMAERLGRLRESLRQLEDFDIQVRMRPGRLGVSVMGLTEQLAAYFGVKDGVLVTNVEAESPAAKAGVKAGDVITAMDDASVRDPEDLRRRVMRVDAGAEFTLTVVRDRKTLTLKGKMEDRGARRRAPLVRVWVD